MYFDVEALIFHVSVDLGTSIPLSELNALTVSLANLQNQIKNCQDSSLSGRLMSELIIILEVQLKLLLEETKTLFRDLAVVLDSLEEEPWSITRVESGVASTVVEIGKETVAVDFGEEEDGVSGFIFEACNKLETSEGDECVSSPASHVSSGKVRKTCAHAVFVALEKD